MMQVLLILIAMASGEVADPFYGDIPEGTVLFYLVEESAGNQYIALQYNGVFITSLSEIPKDNSFVDVYYDTPWNPQVKRNQVFSRLKNPELTSTVVRRDRLKKGWTEHEYVLRETPEGKLYPVTAKQLALAKRARAMVDALEVPASGEHGEAEIQYEETAPRQPSWLQLWGMHLLVALVVFSGIVLMLVLMPRKN